MIKIPADAFKAAGKLLKRHPFTRGKLSALTHLAAYADGDGDGVTLVVASLDQRLETRIPLAESLRQPESFLIPPDAFRNALKADRGSIIGLTCVGARKNRTVRVNLTCNGISIETQYPTKDISDFPQRPALDGPSAVLPARTIEMLTLVSSCASNDESRHVLNGVYFAPEDGGMLVATDGRRLAGAPATVPPAGGFILPNGAVHILAHPDFASRACTVTITAQKIETEREEEKEEEDQVVSFQSENHLLVSKTITGNYPNWKQVVPREMVASVTIAEDRRPAIVSWLRSLRGQDGSVTLRHKKRGFLQLTHAINGKETATVEVAATQTGTIPAIALDPAYLATALEIAPTLWLTNSISPVVARRADGVFCVVMPLRLNSGEAEPTSNTKAPSPDQAAA